MKEIYAIEVSAVVKELQFLSGSKLSKIYEPSKDEIVFAFHTAGEGKSLLRIVPGTCLYLTEKRKASPLTPFNFCVFLRKRIQNSVLKSIQQKDFERIVEFVFEKRDEKYILIAELFSKGNIVLCDENLKIISALKVQHWKDRKIKANEQYIYPPPSGANIFKLSFADFCRIINDSDKENLVKILAIDFGLGGIYAEELCARAKVDKNIKIISDNELKKLFDALEEMRKLNIHANISNGLPFPFIMQTKKVEKEFQNFNLALDFYYSSFIKDDSELAKDKTDEKLDEQRSILESQKKQMRSIKQSIEENTLKGNKIYENYSKVNEILERIKNMRKKGISWQDIKKNMEKTGIQFDEKNKKVVIELK